MHIARWIDFQRSDADDGRWRNWFNARNAIKWWHTDASCAYKWWHTDWHSNRWSNDAWHADKRRNDVCSDKWWHIMSGERFDHQDDGSEELPDHVAGSTRMLVKSLACWHGTACHARWVNAEHRRSNRRHADASRWNIDVHSHHHNMFTRV